MAEADSSRVMAGGTSMPRGLLVLVGLAVAFALSIAQLGTVLPAY
jgi:hypothetical protein